MKNSFFSSNATEQKSLSSVERKSELIFLEMEFHPKKDSDCMMMDIIPKEKIKWFHHNQE
jgi:hypothetical protein